MTMPDFITRIEGYYGAKYPAGQLPYVKTYLAEKTDRALDFIFAETLKAFSSQFGKCPDIAIFDGLRGEIQGRLELEQDFSIPAITDTAGNEYVDMSETLSGLEKWLEEKGR